MLQNSIGKTEVSVLIFGIRREFFIKYHLYRSVVMATHQFNCFAMMPVAFDDCNSISDFVCLRIWSDMLQVWSHQASLTVKTEAMLSAGVNMSCVCLLSGDDLSSLPHQSCCKPPKMSSRVGVVFHAADSCRNWCEGLCYCSPTIKADLHVHRTQGENSKWAHTVVRSEIFRHT